MNKRTNKTISNIQEKLPKDFFTWLFKTLNIKIK